MFNRLTAIKKIKGVKPILLACTTVLSLSHCAQMGEPTGGLKDESAPEIIPSATFPKNGSTHFNSTSVVIGFNESIQVKQQQIVITPALKQKPDVKVKGKKLYIDFKELPDSNTTYTINLSGAVTDITENNAIENMQYVFSTGTFLDSMQISGRVLNAFSKKGVNSAIVILHTNVEDSTISTIKPAYFLKTDKEGFFQFKNLKAGQYKIYSISDRDADLLYDNYPEEIAFSDSSILLDSSLNNVSLLQFKPTDPKTYFKGSIHLSKTSEAYRYNNKVSKIKIDPIRGIGTEKIKLMLRHLSDSLFTVHIRDTTIKDTIQFKLLSNDEVIDTLNFTAHLNPRLKNGASFKLKLPAELYPNDSIFIATSVPVIADESKIMLTDTLSGKPVSYKVVITDFGVKIIIEQSQDKFPLKINCKKGAFKSIDFGYASDSLMGVTTVLPVEKTGSITFRFGNSNELKMKNPICVILFEGNFYVKRKVEEQLMIDKLKPGNYTFYVFDDKDQNMEWSTGNYSQGLQPEEIKWYPGIIKVKANWEQDITWK